MLGRGVQTLAGGVALQPSAGGVRLLPWGSECRRDRRVPREEVRRRGRRRRGTRPALCLWIVYLMSCLSCVYSGERKQRWERVASGMHWERWWEGYCGPNDTITLLGDMVEDYSGPIVTPSPHWAQGGSDQGRGGLGRTTIHHEGEESC